MNRVLVASMAGLLLIGLVVTAVVVLPWALRLGARAFKTKSKSTKKIKETDETR